MATTAKEMIFVNTNGVPKRMPAEMAIEEWENETRWLPFQFKKIEGITFAQYDEPGTHRYWRGLALVEKIHMPAEYYRNFHLKSIPGAYELARRALENLNKIPRPAPGHYLKTGRVIHPIAINAMGRSFSEDACVQTATPNTSAYGCLHKSGDFSYSGNLCKVFNVSGARCTQEKKGAYFWTFRPDQLPGAGMGIEFSGLVPVWEI